MNDIRRTILWVIFGFSMVLLWDQWQIHNGNKATFFPSPAKTTAPAAAAPAGKADVLVPAATAPAGAAGQAGAASSEGATRIINDLQQRELRTRESR